MPTAAAWCMAPHCPSFRPIQAAAQCKHYVWHAGSTTVVPTAWLICNGGVLVSQGHAKHRNKKTKTIVQQRRSCPPSQLLSAPGRTRQRPTQSGPCPSPAASSPPARNLPPSPATRRLRSRQKLQNPRPKLQRWDAPPSQCSHSKNGLVPNLGTSVQKLMSDRHLRL